MWRSGPNQQAELAAYAFDFAGTDIDVHADVHEVMFTPYGNMYVATDGGIYKSTMEVRPTSTSISFAVAQFYGMDWHAALLWAERKTMAPCSSQLAITF